MNTKTGPKVSQLCPLTALPIAKMIGLTRQEETIDIAAIQLGLQAP